MKIDKSSWHYRLLAGSPVSSIPSNLCPYMRKVVVALGFWAVLGTLVITVSSAVIFLLGLGIASYAAWITHGIPEGHKIFLLFGTAVYLVISHMMAWEIYGYRDWWRTVLGKIFYTKYKPRAQKPEKPPSLVREYFNAKHDKICPTLTFEENT